MSDFKVVSLLNPGGTSGVLALSAGTAQASSGTVVFSNSNGVSFGLNGQTLTASAVGGAGGGVAISGGTTQITSGTALFSNANGVSFGVDGQTVTASHNGLTEFSTHNSAHHSGTIFPPNVNQYIGSAYLEWAEVGEPAAPSADIIRMFADDEGTKTRMFLKAPDGTLITISQDGFIVGHNKSGEAAVAGEVFYVDGSSAQIADMKKARADADATMPAVAMILDSADNGDKSRFMIIGVARDIDTSAFTEGDRLFVSATTAGAITNVEPSHPNLKQRVGVVIRRHAGAGRIMLFFGAIRGDHEGTNRDSWLVGNAAAGAKSVVFINANTGNLAWNPSADRTINLPDGDGTLLTTAALSDHSHGNPQLNLTNLSGTTNSNSAGFTLSLSAAAPGGGGGINAISGGTTEATSGTVHFSNSNGVSFGMNGQTMTASVAPGGAGDPLQFYQNIPLFSGTQTFNVLQSTSHVVPFVVGGPVSIGWARVIASMVTNSTSVGTTANRTISARIGSTLNAVIYQQGSGASSLSLQSVVSASALFQSAWLFTAGAQGSQHTRAWQITYPVSGTTTNFGSTAPASATNVVWSTNPITAFTGTKFFDIPFEASLPPGNYWLMFGMSSSTTLDASASAFTGLRISQNIYAISQQNSSFGRMGAATNSSIQLQPGLGSFTTAGGGTVSELALNNISSSASHNLLYFQFINREGEE
jgi:hypothetical protein